MCKQLAVADVSCCCSKSVPLAFGFRSGVRRLPNCCKQLAMTAVGCPCLQSVPSAFVSGSGVRRLLGCCQQLAVATVGYRCSTSVPYCSELGSKVLLSREVIFDEKMMPETNCETESYANIEAFTTLSKRHALQTSQKRRIPTERYKQKLDSLTSSVEKKHRSGANVINSGIRR